jgi:hypothetical protein
MDLLLEMSWAKLETRITEEGSYEDGQKKRTLNRDVAEDCKKLVVESLSVL